MTSKDQSKTREDAVRVSQWLREHRAEFEAPSIREAQIVLKPGRAFIDHC